MWGDCSCQPYIQKNCPMKPKTVLHCNWSEDASGLPNLVKVFQSPDPTIQLIYISDKMEMGLVSKNVYFVKMITSFSSKTQSTKCKCCEWSVRLFSWVILSCSKKMEMLYQYFLKRASENDYELTFSCFRWCCPHRSDIRRYPYFQISRLNSEHITLPTKNYTDFASWFNIC